MVVLCEWFNTEGTLLLIGCLLLQRDLSKNGKIVKQFWTTRAWLTFSLSTPFVIYKLEDDELDLILKEAESEAPSAGAANTN